MRYVFLLLLAAACGYGVLQIDNLDPDNYVKMYLGNYVIEIKVLGFLLLVVAIVAVLYIVLSLVRKLWRAPASFAKWRQRKSVQKADQALGSGYLSLIKGDWKLAEKQLTSKSEHSTLPYINYLAAAQAAQEQGRLVQRDDYLNAAYKAAPDERFAIGLTKARLHQTAGQLDAALATLEDVANIGHKNPQFTAMLVQTYEQMGDWSGVQGMLATAKKQAALPAGVLSDLNRKCYAAHLVGSTNVSQAWRDLPKEQKKQPDNVLFYARHLITEGDISAAEKLLRSTLNTSWDDRLVHLYGMLETDKPGKLRRTVEGWLMARPENAELNLAAGSLTMREGNYETAIDYLQAAIRSGRLAKAYSLLGDAYEATGDSGKALQLYRSGMLALSNDADRDVSALKEPIAIQVVEDSEQAAQVKEGELIANNS